MKIALIHGQSHKGSTYHIAKTLADELGGAVREFFLPRDFNETCTGCNRCFCSSETECPHYEKLQPLTEAMDEADVIIMASPVYVYHVTGAMKSFLDHYGYQWMVHRPKPAMFHKQMVCISTAAGAGMKSTNKDMADSGFFWGIPKIWKYGLAVAAVTWDGVSEDKREKIKNDMSQLAAKIRSKAGKVRPTLKTRGFFQVMRNLHKRGWNEADTLYWDKYGWHGSRRPWDRDLQNIEK